jgi:phage tail sheath protein FI
MSNYRAPGVYTEEISTFPPSVAAVATAIPAFIGYTARRPPRPLPPGMAAADPETDRPVHPIRISSLLEFEELFGRGVAPEVNSITLDANHQFVRASLSQTFHLYAALQLFYANGGGDCYIVSVGGPLTATTALSTTELGAGIAALETWDEPTILLMPDAASFTTPSDLYGLQDAMLLQCQTMKDRVAVLDMPLAEVDGSDFRDGTGIVGLSYGAAYTPWLNAPLGKPYDVRNLNLNTISYTVGGAAGADEFLEGAMPNPEEVTLVTNVMGTAPGSDDEAVAMAALYDGSPTYRGILRGLNDTEVAVPPSGAVAGLYAFTDRQRGVWKAPANISVSGISSLTNVFNESQLENLNVDVNSGKSINAIRFFSGRGNLVFGARTLAGNDSELRYISVRRLMNMLEESINKATAQFVFDANDANTWTRVQGMIENFLTSLWRDGALQGVVQEHAFRVAVGLGRTMTPQDVIDGRMIVEIKVAPVRPAEFIVLRFMQHLPNS